MSEHLLFLQSAGTDFNAAHDLVAAVKETVRASSDEQATEDVRSVRHQNSGNNHGVAARRPALDPERMAERLQQAGCDGHDGLLVALAVLGTNASSVRDEDIDWIASVAARVGNADPLLEAAGVMFAFNTINRIADARRVPLEYRFLRELKPIRGWVERRLASLTGLAYDLSFKHQPRHSSAALMDRVGVVFDRLGMPDVPDVFNWLSGSPVVLEGVLEMLEANVTGARVRTDLLKQAAAIGVASRAMPGSSLGRAVEQWLPSEALSDSKSLRAWAAPSGASPHSDLESACRAYSWQVANAAYTITDEQIRNLRSLGLSDAELLDLTLATAVFSALAIIEPISAAVARASTATETTVPSTRIHETHVQLA